MEQFEKKNAETPNVGWKSVRFMEGNFRGHVLEGPPGVRGRLGGNEPSRPAEVAKFCVKFRIEQHVFGFNIPVQNSPGVNEGQAFATLLEDPQSCLFGDSSKPVDVVQETSVFSQLE